ncbi:hypothetical protein BC827DRAFT_1252382 [Russula dissimulans]|nr:hypothetical protein BC827DRAFT_1252382 [Russula dissimulans]
MHHGLHSPSRPRKRRLGRMTHVSSLQSQPGLTRPPHFLRPSWPGSSILVYSLPHHLAIRP